MTMKTKTIFTMAALAAVLAGCSDNEDMTLRNNYPADGVIRMNVAVNDPQTRATYSDANTLTDFRIIVDNPKNKTYTYNNILVNKSGADWIPENTQMLWANDSDPVTIIAYKSAVNNPNYTIATADVPVNIQTEQGQDDNMLKSDFLFFKHSNFIPKVDLTTPAGKVDIRFQHVLSKLTLTINLGTELNEPAVPENNPIENLKINGTSVSGTTDFGNAQDTKDNGSLPAVITDPTAPTGTVSPLFIEYTEAGNKTQQGSVKYDCILIPQIITMNKFSVSFDVRLTDNEIKKYTWTSDKAVTLQPGTAHTLTLLAGKEVVLVGDITAGEWTVEGNQNIATE